MKYSVVSFSVIILLFLPACGSLTLPTPIAQETATAPARTLLIWESAGKPCETAIFSSAVLSYGKCSGALTNVSAQETGHESRLSELTSHFASFTANTQSGSVIFNGSGNAVPTKAEQRAIVEWANLTVRAAKAGRTEPSWSRALAWQRDGGPGDFCDEVSVYLTGLVRASNCKGFSAHAYLAASQLEQFYGWVDDLAAINYDDRNAPLASGMILTLALIGNGQQQADEKTIREIISFAADLNLQLTFGAAAGPNVRAAEQALHDFLAALHTGDYALAAKLYSGDTDLLQTWNPDINNDLPALFARACTQNGLQCLAPRSITFRASEMDGHQFWVEFSNRDGTLFRQGPCCGETNGRTISLFPFFVEETGDLFTVTDLPPYVP